MDEHVAAAAVQLNEAKALCCIEPFHIARRDVPFLLKKRTNLSQPTSIASSGWRLTPSGFTPAIMNTTELVPTLAEAHGVNKAQAESIIDDFLKNILDAAASGEEVSLPGFGKFKIKETPELEGRNPANGEKIKIAASRTLTFSSAKAVKDLLNG
jgi:DNA-binding protein HU-beta